MRFDTLRVAVALFSMGLCLSAQGPVPQNTNPKPAGCEKPKGNQAQSLQDAAMLLTTVLRQQEMLGKTLPTDDFADKWAIMAKLWEKLDDGTICVPTRPANVKAKNKGLISYATTYPNRITTVGGNLVGVLDGNDSGNAIAIWADQWNADGTFKVRGVPQQSKQLSTVLLAAILFHELCHADQHVYTPSVPEAGEHWDIHTGTPVVFGDLADFLLNDRDREVAGKQGRGIGKGPSVKRTVDEQIAEFRDQETKERPPNNPNQ